MSDIPVGWAELISMPLGPKPADDTPLAALPCLVGVADFVDPTEPRPSTVLER